MAVPRIFEGRTVCCVGTGPSLRIEQVDVARRKGFALAGCNLVYKDVPDLALLFATNELFWFSFWGQSDGPDKHPCEKWTNSPRAAETYRLHYIDSRDRPGLSRDPTYIHHGHGSGQCLVNVAFLAGAARIVLLGYDMKYAPDYNGARHQVGSSPRHYFGEYPSALLHWPQSNVQGGVHMQLIEHYNSIAKQALVEIINCSPGSAIECFPKMSIEDV